MRVTKGRKWKSEKSFEAPKFSSVLNLPPQQLWSKNCRTAILWIFVGHQVIHSESAQIIGDFDNNEWKKSPTNGQFQSNQFFTVPLLATGMSNMYTVCPEEQFKVQTPLRNWNNYKLNWTNSWKMFKICEKIHVVGAKTFKQRCWNRNIHVHVFFCEKYISEANIYFRKSPGF